MCALNRYPRSGLSFADIEGHCELPPESTYPSYVLDIYFFGWKFPEAKGDDAEEEVASY